MLGAAPETRGSIAAVVEAYRAHGLFRRWPIEYIASHGDGSRSERFLTAVRALRRFGELLARERRVAVHLHTAARANFWRDLPYMLASIAAGRPLLLQLHGAGFERFYDRCDTAARAVIRFVLERAASVIVATDSRRSWVRSICRNANAVVVPNPVMPIDVAPAPGAPDRLRLAVAKFEARDQPLTRLFGRLRGANQFDDRVQVRKRFEKTLQDVSAFFRFAQIVFGAPAHHRYTVIDE